LLKRGRGNTMAKDLRINPRIIKHMAHATIRNLIDGIVELVTNSDDSYRRLEEQSIETSGKIIISIVREKGGKCRSIEVKDYAEGMTKEELEKALEFGGDTSGFTAGKSVRGLFGRGLKETIVAFGRGTITTVKNGRKVQTRVWSEGQRSFYDDEMLLKETSTTEENGTTVKIEVENPKYKIPQINKFQEQLERNYALRDINSNPKRFITLKFTDVVGKRNPTPTTFTKNISFKYPEGKLVYEDTLTMSRFKDRIYLKIFECDTMLDSPKNNPSGLAGILIKTKSAILDNQLFKFENEPAGLYFYGFAICLDLEERLRSGDIALLDLNRGGLNWKQEYCKVLSQTIEAALEPFVLKKKKELEKGEPSRVKEKTKKLLKKLCKELNRLAMKELEEEPDTPSIIIKPDISTLLIKPEKANIQYNKPRTFSVYAPTGIILFQKTLEVKLSTDSFYIKVNPDRVKLKPHPIYPKRIQYNHFKVLGLAENIEGTIKAELGEIVAISKVVVREPRKRKRGELTGRKSGFFSEIMPDETANPIQRVYYKDGVIYVCVNHPAVSQFIKPGLGGLENEAGKMLLAELVGEAFSRLIVLKGFETGKYPVPPSDLTSSVSAFLSKVNEIQAKYLPLIQKIIFNWKFD
jgi:hypothetical protein